METAATPALWKQRLLVTFRAAADTLDDIVEDIEAITPISGGTCGASARDGLDAEMMDVSFELSDNPALLDRVIGVIFRAQDGIEPKIRVERIIGGRHDAEKGDGCGLARPGQVAAAAA